MKRATRILALAAVAVAGQASGDRAADAAMLTGPATASTSLRLTCTTPSNAQCADPNFLRSAAGNVCEQSWSQACAGRLDAWATSQTTRDTSQFDPAKSDFVPARMVSKFTATATDKKTLATKTGTFETKQFSAQKNSYKYQEQAWDFQAMQGATTTPASSYWSVPGYAQAGQFITSCTKYVYYSFFEEQRFDDGLRACKGEHKCMVSVAFDPSVGISPVNGQVRGLRDSLGRSVSTRVNELASRDAIPKASADPWTPNDSLMDQPKNSLFAGAERFFTPAAVAAAKAVDPAKAAELQAMINVLHRNGRPDYYRFYDKGTGGAVISPPGAPIMQGFADEWDWHGVMNQRTQALPDGTPMSDGHFAEFDRRNRRALKLWADVYDQVKCELVTPGQLPGCKGAIPSAIGRVHPGDQQIREQDLFLQQSIFANVDPANIMVQPSALDASGSFSSATIQSLAFTTYGATGVNLAFKPTAGTAIPMSHTVPSGSTTGTTMPTLIALPIAGGALSATLQQVQAPHMIGYVASLGTPTLDHPAAPVVPVTYTSTGDVVEPVAYGTLGGVVERMWSEGGLKFDFSQKHLTMDCQPPMTTKTVVVNGVPRVVSLPTGPQDPICLAMKMELDEWARKLDGKPSCLDEKGSYCDWSPGSFVGRFLGKYRDAGSAAKEAELAYCKAWTGGGDFFNVDKEWVGLTLAEMQDIAAFRKRLDARRGAFEKIIKNVPVGQTDEFGESKRDEQTVGGDFIGGGFHYDFRWNAHLHRKPKGSTPTLDDGKICGISSAVVNDYGAEVSTPFGKFGVVDQALESRVNQGLDGKIRTRAAFELLRGTPWEISLLGSFDDAGNPTGGDAVYDVSGVVSPTLQAIEERQDLFDVPFQIAWFTVEISGGVDFTASALASFSGAANPKCDVAKVAFDSGASLLSDASVGAYLDAGISLAGIVGAGVEGELTLLGLSAPAHGNVRLVGSTSNTSTRPKLDVDLGLDLKLHALDGRFKVWVEVFWVKVVNFTLFSWKGLEHTFPLFHTKATIPIAPLDGFVLKTNTTPPAQ